MTACTSALDRRIRSYRSYAELADLSDFTGSNAELADLGDFTGSNAELAELADLGRLYATVCGGMRRYAEVCDCMRILRNSGSYGRYTLSWGLFSARSCKT
jgi:hypothetical protein